VALRDDIPCFLDKPEWQEILLNKPADSMISEEWTHSWQCLPLLCFVPRLLTICREIVRNKQKQTEEAIESLVVSASLLRNSFLDMAAKHGWKSGVSWPILAPRNPDEPARAFCDVDDQKTENFANYLSALAVIDRILFALRPSAVHLEQESVTACLEIQYIHSYLKEDAWLSKFWLVHAERMALSVLMTSAQWESERTIDNGPAFDPKIPGGGFIVDREAFDMFDDILSARTTSTLLM
jgi:hypothetical protein